MQTSQRRFDPLPVLVCSLLLGAIIVVGGLALYEANQVTVLADKLYKHPLTVSNALRDIRISIYTIDRGLRDAVLAETTEQLGKELAKIGALEKEAFSCFDLVEERFLGDETYVLSARRDFANWRAIRSEIIALIKQGRQKEATAIIRGRNVAQIALINEGADGKAGLNYLLNFAKNKGTEFRTMASEKGEIAAYHSLFIFVLTILVSFVVVVLLRRSINITSALNESEERNRLLVESASDGIICFDNHGRIVSWNNSAETIFGYSFDEVIGKSMDIIIPERLRKRNAKAFREMVSPENVGTIRHLIEISVLRKNGTEFTAEVSYSCWELRKKIFCNAIIRDVSERKQAEEALKRAHDELDLRVKERTAKLKKVNEKLKSEISVRIQTEEDLTKSEKQINILSTRLLEVEELERKRITQELHDSVGQALTSLKFSVEDILHKLTGKIEERVFQSLGSLIPKIQNTIIEVNRIGRGLRPSMLDDLGILSTISWFCREFQEVYSGIHIDQEIAIEENDIPENLKGVIFRVLQESLNNVAKHSGADYVSISLKKTNSSIEFSIKDNGKGFDPQSMLFKEVGEKGLGLTGIVKRMEFSGGSCEITSGKESGTLVKGKWPC
jgi:PAS domain S-box-containing protein